MNNDSLYNNDIRYFALLIFFIVTVATYSQQLQINLQEAVNISLNQNERIKQAEQKIIQKEYSNISAWGNFLPSINFCIDYNNLNEPLSIDLNPIRNVIISLQSKNQAELTNIYSLINTGSQLTDAQKNSIISTTQKNLNNILPEFKETLKEKEYLTGGFNFVQPIFMGGKLFAGKKAASIELLAAKHEMDKTKNETTAEVINLYLQTLLLKHLTKTREDYLSGILQHKDRAEKLFIEGIIAYNQYLRSIVAADEAEQKLMEEKNNLELSILALKFKLNLNINIELFLTDSLSINTFDSNDNSDLPIEHPFIKILEDKEKLLEQNYHANRSSFLPSIYAFGKYDIFPQYLSALEPRFVVGLRLNYNLFHGLKDYSKLQEIKSIEEELKQMKKETIRSLELGKQKALADIAINKFKYEKLNSSILSARENLRQNEKRFETGLGNSVDVIDAQLYLEKIELDKHIAAFYYCNAINQYSLIMGDQKLFLNTFYNRSAK